MHRSIAVHNPYNLFILTIVYRKNLTTSYLLTIEHMAMFVVKSIHIQIYGQFMDLSISTGIQQQMTMGLFIHNRWLPYTFIYVRTATGDMSIDPSVYALLSG